MNEIQYYVYRHDLRREWVEKQNRLSGYISELFPLFEFRLELFYVQLEYIFWTMTFSKEQFSFIFVKAKPTLSFGCNRMSYTFCLLTQREKHRLTL